MDEKIVDGMDEISRPYDNHETERKIHSKKCQVKSDLYLYKNTYLEKRDDKRLRSAASTNDVERLNRLLDSGVNPNTADGNGRTALHLACCRGYSDIVKSLLDHNADCNVVDKLGNTPLHLAVCTTSKTTVDLLLKAGCSVSVKAVNGCTPLQLAKSKLWLLQRHTCPDYNTLKLQVSEVIEMMKKLVEDESEEAQLVENFSSRLSLSQNSDQVTDDVKQLLDSLGKLNINRVLIKPSKFTSNSSSLTGQFEQSLNIK